MILFRTPKKTQWDLNFTLLGVPVRVSPWFWLMALMLSWGSIFTYVLAGVGCVFVSILVHEFGHALSGRHFEDKENSVLLHWMGGLCISGGALPSRWPTVAMILWGPLAGFMLGLAAELVWAATRYQSGLPPFWDFVLQDLFWINLIWGLMNLVPVLPLDGGQILHEMVRWKKPHLGDLFVFKVSFISAIVVAVLALAYAIYNIQHGTGTQYDFIPVILFASLAYSSHMMRKQVLEYGEMGGFEERREAWEQDPDWWKRGGR